MEFFVRLLFFSRFYNYFSPFFELGVTASAFSQNNEPPDASARLVNFSNQCCGLSRSLNWLVIRIQVSGNSQFLYCRCNYTAPLSELSYVTARVYTVDLSPMNL